MAKSKRDRFDGYRVEVFRDEDGDWLAHLVEMPNVSAFGPTPEAALDELAVAWDLVKESYAEEDKPLPVAPMHREFSGCLMFASIGACTEPLCLRLSGTA